MNNNNNSTQLSQIIAQTQSPNNNVRQRAESQLKQYEDSNFSQFVLELCRILGSNTEKPAVRTGAGLALKNCVGGARSVERLNTIRKRWSMQQKSTRDQVKQAILTVLASPNRDARSTAINVISNLASVETLSEWKNLVPTLIEKCLTKNDELMHSALKCMGQIAEDTTTHSDLQNFSAKILECIANGMSRQGQIEVQSEAMKCLYHIIELIAPNMQIDKERTIIFQMVCCGASNNSNQQLRLNSFMAISRIVEYYYDLLKPYMQAIFQISREKIERGVCDKENDDVTKQAIEIWSTCAEIEFDIDYEIKHSKQKCTRTNFGFVNKCLELLCPIYLRALLKQKDDYDEDEWTIRKAAACSLELFSHIAKDNILKYVLQFVEGNISQKNWRQREAALCAFGSVLDGPDKEKLVRLVGQICPVILQLMTDSHIQVRTTATWSFGRICEIVPNAIGNRDILRPIVTTLNDRNSIANKACWCIASLTSYYASQTNAASAAANSCIYVNDNAFKLIKELLQRSARNDSNGFLIIATHEALNNIIYYMPTSDSKYIKILQSLLPELIAQMLACANSIRSSGISDATMHRMAGLFSSVQVLISKLGVGCLNADLTNQIMHCCCFVLSTENSLVYEEALGLITHVSSCIGDKFTNYLLADNIQELLLKSIKIGANNEQICRIGAGCIGDAYRSCTSYLSQNEGCMKLRSYTDRIVSELLTILINNTMDIVLKSHVIDALTDILIAHGSNASRYSGDILDKCLQIGTMNVPQNVDDEVIETFNEIRCSIIDTCRTCLAELAQANMIQKFSLYIPKLHQFFNAISNDTNSSIHVIASCIKLLCESADYLSSNQELKKQLKTNDIIQILNKASSSNDAMLKQEAQNAFNALR